MSENEITKPGQALEGTQVEQVSGGLNICSGDDLIDLTRSLKESYDNLVDVTSYVIERVLGK